jgi:hypothetical protein
MFLPLVIEVEARIAANVYPRVHPAVLEIGSKVPTCDLIKR